jgi:hypothetical protein
VASGRAGGNRASIAVEGRGDEATRDEARAELALHRKFRTGENERTKVIAEKNEENAS